MATFPRGAVERFVIERLGLTRGCKQLAGRIIESYEGDPEDYTALFEHCFAMLDEICLAATDAAAALEAEFYQLIREFSTGEAYDPVFESGYTSESVSESLHAFIKKYSENKNFDALSGKMAQRVGMEIDHAIAYCAEENGKNDKREKKWARVPGSPTPCTFCCMLASRGFDYSSYESARGKKGSHYGECRCTVMQGYEGMQVEGYDKDAYYRQWKKLEEIDKRDDLTDDEKSVLHLVAADSEHKFNLEQSKELAAKLGEVVSQRRESFKFAGYTKESYAKTVEAWIKDVGKIYEMDFSGEYLLGNGLSSAMPDGYELWAATRLRNRYQKMQFLGEDSSRRKGNPDLLVEGKYIEIKTPKKVQNVEDKIHEGYMQCNNRGGNGGLVILSPLRLEALDDRYMRYARNTIRRKRRNGQEISAIVIDELLNLVDLPEK